MKRSKAFAVLGLAFVLAASYSPGAEDEGKTTIVNVSGKEALAVVAKEKDLVIVDVRTPVEYQEGHLQNARNVDFHGIDFGGSLADSLKKRDVPILVYCRSGRRSTSALKTFKQLGFLKVYHLDGGVAAWVDAGGDLK